MSYSFRLLFRIYYTTIIYGYPLYKITFTKKEKLWVIYFLILGAYYFIESKFLILFKFLFNKNMIYILKAIKASFFLWLYHPTFLGALLLEQIYGKIIDNIFSALNPSIGQHLSKLGFSNKAVLISDIKYTSYEDSSEKIPFIYDETQEKENEEQIKEVRNPILPVNKKLNNGKEIPYIGLGTSRISNIIDVVYNSIKDGMRLIDTAFKYGNEEDIGKGIKKALKRRFIYYWKNMDNG